MSDLDAKIPERFIFRVDPAFYSAISDQADAGNRSVNGEICTAVDKWLYERDALVLMKDRLLASASEMTIRSIRTSTPSYLITPDTPTDKCKTTVRFKETVNADLRAAWERHKAQSGHVSLNSYIKIVVAWWLTYSYQLAECAKAIHRDFVNSVRPTRSAAAANVSIIGYLAQA